MTRVSGALLFTPLPLSVPDALHLHRRQPLRRGAVARRVRAHPNVDDPHALLRLHVLALPRPLPALVHARAYGFLRLRGGVRRLHAGESRGRDPRRDPRFRRSADCCLLLLLLLLSAAAASAAVCCFMLLLSAAAASCCCCLLLLLSAACCVLARPVRAGKASVCWLCCCEHVCSVLAPLLLGASPSL